MAEIGQFPPVLGRRFGDRVPCGLLVTAGIAGVLALGFDLSSIASIGSVIALIVFGLVTAAHVRVRAETGARLPILLVGLASTVIVLVAFVFTTLVEEPGTAIMLVMMLVLGVVLDLWWKHRRPAMPVEVVLPADG
jgi:amino acid transporter